MNEGKKRTVKQNSIMMSKIKNKGSKIEKVLQKELWSRGLRYRKNDPGVFGKPDICFRGLKIAVFCDSEFWHGYDWDNERDSFKSNREFWIPKIENNIARDKKVTHKLQNDGWIVLRYWGRDILKNSEKIADEIQIQCEKSKQKSRKYRSIDLFAGIGGIRMGFDQAFKKEIETVYVSEIDGFAQETYRNNFHDKFEITGDITKAEEKDIPQFDICLAGFPCQAFSIAGIHGGFNDDYHGMCRGTLFLDVVRICDCHRPKVIFCENVKGLTIHDRGKTFEIIKKAFEEIGYTLYDKVLNSKDFGVPQNRERIYIVCFRNDVDSSAFAFPEPTNKPSAIMDIMDPAPVPAKYYLSDTYLETLRKHRARHKAKGNGFGYEIKDVTGIAGTIVCGGMGRERNLIIDHRMHSMEPTTHIKGKINDEDIRKMTPREWARLQGFPDSFELGLADTHLYKQFGNSVTVPVIEAIALKIKEVLDNA